MEDVYSEECASSFCEGALAMKIDMLKPNEVAVTTLVGRSTAILTAIFSILCLDSVPGRANEYMVFKIYEHKYEKKTVPVQLSLPAGSFNAPYPLIITQHGSSPNKSFTEGPGNTDEYSYRLTKMATARGYAVAAIDAFFEKNLQPTDKRKFPLAHMYAEEIKNKLAVRQDIDGSRLFYTGFSYGGTTTLYSTIIPANPYKPSWRALAAAEPGCNAFPEPKWITHPILILKGAESHYAPKPCRILVDLFNKEGSKVTLKIFPKSNHHFSHNGRRTNGIAFNGCEDNPVILRFNGKHTFLDGSPADKAEVRWSKCFTQRGGSGKTYEDLDAAIFTVIDFFDKS